MTVRPIRVPPVNRLVSSRITIRTLHPDRKLRGSEEKDGASRGMSFTAEKRLAQTASDAQLRATRDQVFGLRDTYSDG